MKTQMAVCLLGSFAIFGVAAWRLRTPAPLLVENYELIDRSGSDPTPCLSLARTLERAIASAPSPASWTFFVTGSTETAYEPVPMPVHSSPGRLRLIDGKERAESRNAAFVNDVLETCKGMPVTDSSPLYIALKHVVAQARQRAGKAEVHVYVITDLRETVEGSIVQALTRPRVQDKLPEPIDVRGMKVQICGYAQTIDRARPKAIASRTDHRADRLIEVWSALLSDPVEFVPFCS